MTDLVRAIRSLDTLSLNCSVEKVPIEAIRKHGSSLRSLRLREYDGIVHRPLSQSRVPTLSLHAFLEILSHCPNIMELALDLDQGVMVRTSSTTRHVRSVEIDRLFCSHQALQAYSPSAAIFVGSLHSYSNPSSMAWT